MSGSLNSVFLIGNLVRNPEYREVSGGNSVCSFCIATNERFKDRSGSKKELVEYHNIVVWGRLAENANKFLTIGSSVFVEGKMKTRRYESNGSQHYRCEVVASNIQFLGKKQAKADFYEEKVPF